MPHPNRSWQAADGEYRYGFNGVEKEGEVYGKGNLSAMDFRMYDPRVGRWWGVDKLVKVHESPYAAMGGNPVNFADPSGLEKEEKKSMTGEGAPDPRTKPKDTDTQAQTEEKKTPGPVVVPFPTTEHKTAGSASATLTVVRKAQETTGSEGKGLNKNVNKAASSGEQKTDKSEKKQIQVQASKVEDNLNIRGTNSSGNTSVFAEPVEI